MERLKNSWRSLVFAGTASGAFLCLAGAVDLFPSGSSYPIYLYIIAIFILVLTAIIEPTWLILICAGMLPFTALHSENVLMYSMSNLPILGIGFGGFLIRRPKDKKLRSSPLLALIPIVLYAIFSLSSFLINSSHLDGMRMILTEFVFLFSTCIIFFRVPQPLFFLRDFFLALAIGGGLVLLYMLLFSPWAGKKSPFPFFENANYFASFLAMLIPGLIWMALTKRSWKRIAWGLAAGLLLLAVLLLQSRGAWLGLAGGTVIGLLYFLRNRIQKLALLFFALTGVAALFFTQPATPVPNPESTTDKIRSLADTQSNFSNRERIMRWTCALRLFEEDPIWGCGPSNYHRRFKYKLETMEEVSEISYWPGWTGSAHSEYLSRLSERGIFLFIAFLALIGLCLFNLHRLVKRRIWGRAWTALVAASLGVWISHGLVEDLSEAYPIWLAVSAIFAASGAAIARHKVLGQKADEPEDPEPPKSKMKPKYMHNPNPTTNFSP